MGWMQTPKIHIPDTNKMEDKYKRLENKSVNTLHVVARPWSGPPGRQGRPERPPKCNTSIHPQHIHLYRTFSKKKTVCPLLRPASLPSLGILPLAARDHHPLAPLWHHTNFGQSFEPR